MDIAVWVGFILLILTFLAIDLGVFNREAHVISTREALTWTSVWVSTAMLFNLFVYFGYKYNWLGLGVTVGDPQLPRDAALQFFTGYIVELSLSVDNLFVIAVIFGYFHVPAQSQHRVLFWGILGALIMRGVMIAVGVQLIDRFHWMIYVFGALLILTAVKLLLAGDEKIDPEHNPLVRLARRLYPVSKNFEGEHFFTKIDGRRAITPLFLVLLVVESTDVLFAVDSIPAIFGITRDPFLVFTSNVFAILGLRSMFFALAGIMRQFHYLKISLVFVLAFVGVKMLITSYYKIPTWVSLMIIAGVLGVGVLASLIHGRKDTMRADAPQE